MDFASSLLLVSSVLDMLWSISSTLLGLDLIPYGASMGLELVVLGPVIGLDLVVFGPSEASI